ncbi:methionine--tRNA ligase [Tistrella bauzanensis]|uniref:Methionine--tRNA ligase n=1 Tax=Tistrella bauzanensis TaxID=657419 RepID=A0ABQ1IGT1_9PROT|nr:methionine--tRNA ligase [Tistrella bauzanensis]GGB38327.1 methionine--tRNA ligase [Tistrella bauzanensis]
MSAADAFYITTPIYYVNDKPHIGHAYTTISCDVIARFMRLDGKRVMFLTGTDEHGQKVAKSAESKGIDPQAFTDDVSERFRELTKLLNISNDDFIRTTEPRHRDACQALWKTLVDKGEIYLGSYAGWYSVRDEAFYQESELVGGKAPTGAEVEWVEEPSYFFRLSAWADRLLAHYERNPEAIQPASRRNEVLSFIRGGLHDLSVSRTTFSWGVPVPGDPAHVMYVWIDALTNYLTAIGYPDTTDDRFKVFWPTVHHTVGKDIVRFHAVYWPAFLMAAGLTPPRRVFAHGWWTIEGEKMSKSIGNTIDPHDLVSTYGLDQTRYFLMREVPFGNDGDFSRQAMIGRINNDLANDFGNLVQRVLSMVQKNCGGKVPSPGVDASLLAQEPLIADAHGLVERVRPLIVAQSYHKALEEIWATVGAANRYIDREAPWTLRKTDPDAMARVLYILMETIRHLALVVQPFLPTSAARVLDFLGVAADDRDFKAVGTAHALLPGRDIAQPQPIFPRIDTSAPAPGAG